MVQCAQHVSVLTTALHEYINSHADAQHDVFFASMHGAMRKECHSANETFE